MKRSKTAQIYVLTTIRGIGDDSTLISLYSTMNLLAIAMITWLHKITLVTVIGLELPVTKSIKNMK